MEFLKNDDLDNIKKYKYVPGVYTPLDNFLTPFWGFLANLLPMNFAPNTITSIGLLFSLSSCIVYGYYSFDLKTPCPTWVYIYGGIAVFLYQTFDALDGKQARRTGSSSPLGQLFDHGCDAFNTGFFCISFCNALGIGSSIYTVILFICSTTVFYSSQLIEYSTGVLNTSDGYVGVTELQDFITCMHLCCGIFGREIFSKPIFTIYGVEINFLLIIITGISFECITFVLKLFYELFFKESPLRGDDVGNKKLGKLDNLLRCLPFLYI